jgi:GntR family transcriptional repressor for pyruvate dehydrogenase complex
MAVTPQTAFPSLRRGKIYEEVAQQIQRRITQHMRPGDTLPPERELAQMFRVSRSSVRDAIRSLEIIGLLEPRQGLGTVVKEVPADALLTPLAGLLLQKRKTLQELLEVRQMIEPPLAARAALRASPEWLAALETIIKQQEQRVRRGELAIEEDSEFHYQIALAADNAVVLKVLDVLMDLLRETRERSLQSPGRLEKSFAGHCRILAALKRRDPRAAEAAMRRHLAEIVEVVLKKLS